MSTFAPKQNYKSRAEAYRLFIQAQNLPRSMSQFYNDCESLGLVKQDKSIDLSSLMAYVRSELKIDTATGQSLVRNDRAQEMDDLEYRKLKAETEKRERENEDAERALDKKWLHRDVAEENLAALVGVLQDSIDHQFYIGAPALIHAMGIDASRVDEMTESFKAMVSSAFAEVLAADKIEGILCAGDEEEEE